MQLMLSIRVKRNNDCHILAGAPGAAGPGLHHLEGVAEEEELGLEEEYPGDEDFYAEMAQHA
jgi:hypothetical protein